LLLLFSDIPFRYARRGEPDKGVQLLQRGANTMRAAGDASGERRVLLIAGAMQHELGQLDDAIASYSNATTLARKANDIVNEGKIYRLVGAVLEEKKDFQSAMHSYKVRTVFESPLIAALSVLSAALSVVSNGIAFVSPRLTCRKVAVQLASQAGDELGLIAGALAVGNAIAHVTPLSAEAVVYWKQALRTCKVICCCLF
jgi:tetratricopeptide (TPR) repeat protein